MALLDIILGLLLLLGLWKGLKNGLLLEIASIVALTAGIYGAIHFSYIAGDYLSQQMNWEERYINGAAFLVTFVLIVVGVHFAGKLLTKVADIAMLGLLNKIAGAIFGAFKMALILGAFLIFFDSAYSKLGLISEEVKNASILYQPIKNIGALVFDVVLREDITEILKTP